MAPKWNLTRPGGRAVWRTMAGKQCRGQKASCSLPGWPNGAIHNWAQSTENVLHWVHSVYRILGQCVLFMCDVYCGRTVRFNIDPNAVFSPPVICNQTESYRVLPLPDAVLMLTKLFLCLIWSTCDVEQLKSSRSLSLQHFLPSPAFLEAVGGPFFLLRCFTFSFSSSSM